MVLFFFQVHPTCWAREFESVAKAAAYADALLRSCPNATIERLV